MNESILQKPLGEIIANKLRREIWNRELQFGERLLEVDLSARFNVSRSTIREALKIIEYEEIVVSKARKGTYVAAFTKNDWREIIELRTLIEPYAFILAIPQLSDKHSNYLSSILEHMNKQADAKDWSYLFDLDMRFHRYVVNLSGNSRIIKIYDSIQVQIRTFLFHLNEYYSSTQVFYNEHKELLDALLSRDSKLVDQNVRKHIEYVEERWIAGC